MKSPYAPHSLLPLNWSIGITGLCGDVYLVATPAGARIDDVKVDTSVRNSEITIEAGLEGLADVVINPTDALVLGAMVGEGAGVEKHFRDKIAVVREIIKQSRMCNDTQVELAMQRAFLGCETVRLCYSQACAVRLMIGHLC